MEAPARTTRTRRRSSAAAAVPALQQESQRQRSRSNRQQRAASRRLSHRRSPRRSQRSRSPHRRCVCRQSCSHRQDVNMQLGPLQGWRVFEDEQHADGTQERSRSGRSDGRADPCRAAVSSMSVDASKSCRTGVWTDPGASHSLRLLQQPREGVSAVSTKPQPCRDLPENLYNDVIASYLRFDKLQSNQLYVVGGRNEEHGPLDTVEMFDTWHGKWVTCPPMSVKRAGCGAASLPDGTLLVAGGYDERGIVEGLLATVEIFNPMKQQWAVSALPLPRARWGHSCASQDGFVYAVGGCSLLKGAPEQEEFMETLKTCEVYNPRTAEWSSAPSLCVARAGARVVALGTQYLAAAGGCDDVFGRGELLSSIELLDVKVGCWTLLDVKLQFPRTTAAIAPVDDRRIFVVGGAAIHDATVAEAEVCEVLPQPSGSLQRTAGPKVAAMPEGRTGCQAVTMSLPALDKSYPFCSRQCIVVVGGERGDDEQGQVNSVLAYDWEMQAWRPKHTFPPIPTERTAAAVCVGHGKINGHA